jgi:hypothetical protein
MNKIVKFLSSVFTAIFKKKTGINDGVIVEIPKIDISVETINHVIDVVNNVKKVVNNPIIIVATDLIPGTLDNRIREGLAAAITPILAGLTFSKNIIGNTVMTGDSQLTFLLSKIRFADDADKDALYHTLAARLIMIASDGKVTWSEAASLIELYFKQIFSAGKSA